MNTQKQNAQDVKLQRTDTRNVTSQQTDTRNMTPQRTDRNVTPQRTDARNVTPQQTDARDVRPQQQNARNVRPQRQNSRDMTPQRQNSRDVKLRDTHRYDDIIRLPHHVSTRHPQMSLENRAAQFSPFAALTGHAAAIEETARLTESFVELDENRKEELSEQLLLLSENLSGHPEVTVTCYQPDALKEGGAYVTIHGQVKSIDLYARQLRFTDGQTVPLDDLYELEIGNQPFC